MPWDTLINDSEIVSIHAALLPTEPDGVVVYYGDWSGGGGGVGVQDVTHTRLHHVGSNTLSAIPLDVVPDTDVFCAGQSFLADGRLLAAGGTFGWAEAHGGIHEPHYDGERACWMYQPRAEAWVRVADLNFQPGSNSQGGGRWYPTLVTLENNQVIAIGGHPSADDYYPTTGTQRHNNNLPERYASGADTWTLVNNQITCPPTVSTDSYPRYHLLPEGRLFSDTAGNDNGNGGQSAKRLYDPWAGEWGRPNVGGLDTLPGFYDRGSEATSVLLPLVPPLYRARILACNSGNASAYRIDVDDTPSWVPTVDREGSAAGRARDNGCATLLPTGQVLVSGGWPGNAGADDLDDATMEPELYTPGIDWSTGAFTGTEQWQTVEEPAARPRGYHSVALLLPDGRVWVGGSTTTAEPLNRQIEAYSPDYVSQGGRPTISSAPANIGYGMNFAVDTPQANQIARVVLIRNGSITHGFNSDQRYVVLGFSVQDGNTLTVQSPPNGRIAPPGYYMLWLIDDSERPCQRARFIRISKQKLIVSADISTYSIHEVDALGTPAAFNAALYVAADGFLPAEVSAPSLDLLFQNNDPVPGVTLNLGAPKYEAGSQSEDTAQRIVYPVNVTFTSTAAFDEIPNAQDFLPMVLYARMGPFIGFVNLSLSKNPNPRMRDGDPPYLSIDLRVFKTNPGDEPTAGVTHPDGAGGAYGYIQDVLAAYNGWGAGDHPFDDLPTDQDVNRLELASQDVNGDPVFNYAVARVRFRAPEGIDAADVRVFFRMWTTGWTALEYSTSGSYRRAGNGAGATPLLGLAGGEINNVPCFAEARSADMANQSDGHNRRTLQGMGATEVYGYFGCWLDVNQDVPRFPLKPTHDGPFDDGDDPDGLRSIQELMRGLHQCLVAEIHYTLDPIPGGATPGSSDNLAQRNILFDDSDNPGGFSAHLVHHTFELKPSPFSFAQAALAEGAGGGSAIGSARLASDELVIVWGELPRDALVTLYMPQVDAREIVAAAGRRLAPPNLRASSDGSVTFRVADIGFMPIPGPIDTAIAGLITVQLPPGVPAGKTYKVVLRQVSGRDFRVLGTTEFRITVKTAPAILPRALHSLSVLRHVAESIPPANRWFPVFQRYLAELGDRVRGFGGDPDAAVPSPTGHLPDGDPGDDGGHDGHDGHARTDCYVGRVKRLLYDCFGRFEGFVLHDCAGSMRFRSCEKGIEAVVLKACQGDLSVAVHYEPATMRPRGLSLECGCADDACPPPKPPGPPARLPPPTAAAPPPPLDAALRHAEAVRKTRASRPRRPPDAAHHH